jgi:hypothetical protein
MFNREVLWFDQPYNTDAGIEVGFYPKHVALWASVLNGEPGSNTRFDSNRELAVVGGALAQFHLGPLGCGVGGSVWHNQKEPAGGRTGERNAGGPFGYFNWGRASWLWEVDESRLTIPAVSSKTAFLTSHEVSYQVRPGFDVVGTYNYVDPDLDVQSGVRERYGLGVEVVPVPFVQLQGNVNMYLTDIGVDVTEDDFIRTEVQLHLFY